MRKYIFISFLLFLIYPVFAGDKKIFTNDDLEKYNNRPDASIEEQNSNTAVIEKQYSNTAVKEQPYPDSRDKEINQLEEKINRLEDRLKKPPRTIPGRDCDVINFTSYKQSYATMNVEIGIGSVTTEQKVTVQIKNKYGLNRWVEHFYIVAFFRDGSIQERQLHPIEDSLTIGSGDTYTGRVTFQNDEPIISMGCLVNPGL